MTNKNKRWSLVEDDWLWSYRDVSIVKLAELSKRTKSAVAYRLQDLRNPKHKANMRLMLHRGKSIGQRHIRCPISHGALKTSNNTVFHHILRDFLPSTTATVNKGSSWNIEDDTCLNNNKDCCYDDLAIHHGRTVRGIRKRMEALADPNSSVSQRLTNPSACKKGQRWAIEDDHDLWKCRDCSIKQLANHFGRSNGSIICRLEILRNPQHKANTRLAAHTGKVIGKRKIACTGSHQIESELSVISNHEELTVEEDTCLFSNRDCCVSSLAKHFNAHARAIKDGLAVLTDGDHSRRMRLNQYLKNDKTKKKRKKRQRRDDDEKMESVRKKRKLNDTEPPSEFCDPITYKLMDEPTLVTLSGYTYERETIKDCIKNNGRDPFTNIKINTKHLVVNRALKESIDRWKRDHGSY